MRGFFTALLCVASLALPPGAASAAEPCPPAPAQSLALPQARAAVHAGRPLTIVAFGSSSTEGAGASDDARTYPAQLQARLRQALPGLRVRVLNRGKGGQEVSEMLARLDADVLAERPAIVIWQAGANAVLQGMAPETFSAAMAHGIARLHAAGAEVVLMDSQRAPRILSAPHYSRFDSALRDLALNARAPLFSRAALMRAWEEAGTPNDEMLSPDGLHHNDRGYACVAAALSRAMQDAVGPALIARR
jgi:lysophospholipase L1-like esterase